MPAAVVALVRNRLLWSRATLDVMTSKPRLPPFVSFLVEVDAEAAAMRLGSKARAPRPVKGKAGKRT